MNTPRVRASAINSSARRLFPTPASPPTSTSEPCPRIACSRRRRNSARSASRPTNGVCSRSDNTPGPTASSQDTVKSRMGLGKPFSCVSPWSSSLTVVASPRTTFTASDTRISPALAWLAMRAAAITVAPKRSSSSRMTSPVFNPMRRCTACSFSRRLRPAIAL